MGWLLLLVLLALVFAGIGVVVHVLWWIAIVAVVVLVVGFAMRSGGGRQHRR